MKPLPRLTLPGATMSVINQKRYIFLFGGWDLDNEKASRRLILVNVTDLEWCYAPLPAMENMVGRISPTVVFIKSKLYIFGGNRDFGDSINPDPCFSYSIANILLEEKGWTWEVIDVPYEEPAKSLVFAYAIPIYNDTKILLTPGRATAAGNKVSTICCSSQSKRTY